MQQWREDAEENRISHVIVGCALEVHRTLGGPGLLESVYEEALVWELTKCGMSVERQRQLPIRYKSVELSTPVRLDLLVNNLVVVECKSTAAYNDIYEVQLRTYLRLANLKLGMVINFGERLVKDGIHRVVNGL